MTLKVKVKSVDQESPYVYPLRRVEITTGAGRVAAPNRAATLYEYNKRSSIPTDIPLDNDVSLAVKRPNATTLANFLKDNGVARRWGREMKSAADRMAYSALSAYIVQPTTSAPAPKKDGKQAKGAPAPSGIEYLGSNPARLERFLRILCQIQVSSGLEIVTVPYLGLALSEYRRLATKISRDITAAGGEPMFVFDLEYQKRVDKFEEAVSLLVRDAGAKLVAFPGRSYTSAPLSYDVLARYAEAEVAFVSFDNDRSYQRLNPLSKMHSLPFIGTDIYAIKTPRFVPPTAKGQEGGGGGTKPAPDSSGPTLDSVKFFEPSSLAIRQSSERVGNANALLDEMGARGNARLRIILGEYESIKGNSDKIAVLSAVSKVHELKSSTAEFGRFRGWIDKAETGAYVDEKPRLKSTLEDLKRRRKKR